MDVTDPGKVLRRAGEIEDSMMQVEQLAADAMRDDIQLGEFLKKMRIDLGFQIPEEHDTSDVKRKNWVESRVMESEDWSKWVTAHANRRAYELKLDVLGKRLTACQSALKRFEREVGGPGVGAGQRNV